MSTLAWGRHQTIFVSSTSGDVRWRLFRSVKGGFQPLPARILVPGCKYQDGSFNKQSALCIDGHALRDFSYAVHRPIMAAARVHRPILRRHFVARVRTDDGREQNSGGELRRPLYEIAGSDPDAREGAQSLAPLRAVAE